MSRGVLAASNVGQEVATTLTSSRAAFVLSSAKGEYVTQITIITDRVATVDGLADPVRASFLVDPADLNGRSVGS